MVTLKILLVDDEPLLSRAVLDLLALLGHSPTWAVDVAEGYDAMLGGFFDALLLDLNLGPERGEHLVERIRVSGAHVPPIVIFSAQPQTDLDESARRIGAATILHKPCDLRSLELALTEAVQHG